MIVIDQSDDDMEVIEKKAEVFRPYYENGDQTIVVRPDISRDENQRGRESTPIPVKIDRHVIGWYENCSVLISYRRLACFHHENFMYFRFSSYLKMIRNC